MKVARVNDARIPAIGAITGLGGTVPAGSGSDDEWTTTPVEFALDDLSDVDTTGVVDGDVLTFEYGVWVALPGTSAGRWELAVIPGSPPDSLYADGDWLYIFVP